MTTAFLLFDRLTALDFVGAYDPITRLETMGFIETFEWDLCAFRERVTDGHGLRLSPDQVAQSLASYDLLVVPGGHGTRSLQHDSAF